MQGFRNKIWRYLRHHLLGLGALGVIALFCLAGIYAPFLASSKPLFVIYEGAPYFPLFRYLYIPIFYSKGIDIFFNLLMMTAPLLLIAWRRGWRLFGSTLIVGQLSAFLWILAFPPSDPASDPASALERHKQLEVMQQRGEPLTWQFELKFMNSYAKLNLLLDWRRLEEQHHSLLRHFSAGTVDIPTLWHIRQQNEARLEAQYRAFDTKDARAELAYLLDRRRWLEVESRQLHDEVMPLFSPFHWEDDAGGSQMLNRKLKWWEMTRINRKDLLAALIFGIRISLVVGILAVALSLIIGVPIGALAGYYGGKLDLFACRLLEIWESMPIFFMLLLVVAMIQSKSVFLVIAVIGLFGWTGFSRYTRGEFLKQRHLPYVEACQAIGFHDSHIIFSHVLPNALPPVLTLLPFAMMGAISSEAGLSFLGLGEEGSCSWGVLMDEGRRVFPGESSLLWPPAILLTLLLVAIALVGDALRDAIDPKMQR